MNVIQRCVTCRHWRPMQEPHDNQGECRGAAPAAVLAAQLPLSSGVEARRVYWPVTWNYEWCGGWAAAPSPAESGAQVLVREVSDDGRAA